MVRGAFLTVLLAVVFFASAHSSTFWSNAGRSSALLYPGAGIALGVLLLVGPRYWLTVALGRFLAFLAIPGQPLGVMLVVSAGNALAAGSGAWIAHRWGPVTPALTSVRSVLVVAIAAVSAAVVGATIGATALQWTGTATPPAVIWTNWFMGSVGGALVFAPLVLAWGSGDPLPRRVSYWIHIGACVAVTAAVSIAVFFGSTATFGRTWLIFPPLIWGALAFGIRGATLALLPATLLGVAGTTMGAGALGLTIDPDIRGTLLQQFVAVASFTALVLAVVADERRGKDALKDRERRLQLALAAARSFGFDFDARAGVVTRTAECAEILGTPALLVERGPAHQFIAHVCDEDRATFEAALHTLSPQAPSARLTYRFVRQDGRIVYLEDSAVAEFAPDGSLLRIVGVSVDVTERRLAEIERETLFQRERAARAEAERAAELREQFLGTVSHELRTPLNAILGWAQILQAGAPSGDALQAGLTTIARNARVQAQLIEDLLDLSRIGTGATRLDAVPLDLARVVHDAVLALAPAAAAKGLHVEHQGCTAGLVVSGDAGRLQQVFSNLLTNAVKFTPEGGRVVVAVERIGTVGCVRITDTGLGIAPEFLPHAFDRFSQADGSTTRRHSGLGIGLALVRELVELHGGTVKAESDGEGHGSTFTVHLPLEPHAEAPGLLPDYSDGWPAASGDAEPSGSVTILVVDDDADARTVAAGLLEATGTRVVTASSAAEGLEALRRERPQVIVADIGMPGIDGYAFIEAVRQCGDPGLAQIPAAAVTALARDEDRRRAIAAGFQVHLTKPVTRETLLAAISRLRPVRSRG